MLDIVVEFSSINMNNDLSFYKQEATYEGRPIPGSPFEVNVAPNGQHESLRELCRDAALGTAPGTWVLKDPPIAIEGPMSFSTANFSWAPSTCNLPDLKCIIVTSSTGSAKCLPSGHRVMIYAIGDSVTRVQAQSLANILDEQIDGEGEIYVQRTHNTIFDVHFKPQIMA